MIIVFCSCEPKFVQNINSRPVLEKSILDKTWKINLINLESIQGEAKDYFLKLNSTSKQFQAKAGCNSIFGEFELKDNFITFSKVGSTKMYCIDAMKKEDALLILLSHSSKVVLVDTTKFILISDDIVVAQFELVQ